MRLVPESPDKYRNARRRLHAALLVVLVCLLLSACSWLLFWPVPDTKQRPDDSARTPGEGGVSVDVTGCEIYPTEGSTRKAHVVKVSAVVVDRRGNRNLFSDFFSLVIDSTRIPPARVGDLGMTAVSFGMLELEKGRPQEVELYFVVPRDSREATLTLVTPEAERGSVQYVAVDLPEGDDR